MPAEDRPDPVHDTEGNGGGKDLKTPTCTAMLESVHQERAKGDLLQDSGDNSDAESEELEPGRADEVGAYGRKPVRAHRDEEPGNDHPGWIPKGQGSVATRKKAKPNEVGTWIRKGQADYEEALKKGNTAEDECCLSCG